MPRRTAVLLEGFDEFWATYPHRVARKDAEKAWSQLAPPPELVQRVIVSLQRQLAHRAAKLARREWVPEWPYPATWLRAERWNDEFVEQRMTMAETQHQKTQRVKELMASGMDRKAAMHEVFDK